jgi:hypothetical protein
MLFRALEAERFSLIVEFVVDAGFAERKNSTASVEGYSLGRVFRVLLLRSCPFG